jgi:hypothetical protein
MRTECSTGLSVPPDLNGESTPWQDAAVPIVPGRPLPEGNA